MGHTSDADALVGFRNGVLKLGTGSTPGQVYVRQQIWRVNTSDTNTNYWEGFWVIGGNPREYYPPVLPDLDDDKDVDGQDFMTFSGCFNGSLRPPKPTCENLDADFDHDYDVDGQDFMFFSKCFNGSLRRPKCIPPDVTVPTNDTCGNATPIIPDCDGNFETVYQVAECALPSEPQHICVDDDHDGETDDEPDVWYKYTPEGSPTITIDLCYTTGLDSGISDSFLAVYEDCGGEVEVCLDNDGAQGYGSCGTGSYHEKVVLEDQEVPIYIAIGPSKASEEGHRFKLTNPSIIY